MGQAGYFRRNAFLGCFVSLCYGFLYYPTKGSFVKVFVGDSNWLGDDYRWRHFNACAQTLAFHPHLPSHWPQAEITLVRGTRQMRFILLRASPEAASQAAAQHGAALLKPGQQLHWTELPEHTSFVITV